MDYLGQLVVIRSEWNLYSSRIGVIIKQAEEPSDVVWVLWTTENGCKIKKHLQDAVLPINEETVNKVRKRICDIK